MFDFMRDDSTLKILLIGGIILILLVPIIHFIFRLITDKKQEDKERKAILRALMEDRQKEKDTEKAISSPRLAEDRKKEKDKVGGLR